MKISGNNIYSVCCAASLWFGFSVGGYSMGLRSFVALPVEKNGAVARLTLERTKYADTDILKTSAAYGVSAHQTLLFGIPYRLSPAGGNRQGDLSTLYRHITWREDSTFGTDRLGLLGGVIVPGKKDREAAVQAGFVFTHFKNSHEIDIDALYQSGLGNRLDGGRYDISWQYRLSPTERPDWGLTQELNTVLELNGRWLEDSNITHQVTVGLQSVHQKLVVEGGVVRELNNSKEIRLLFSIRIHL